jgi:hypothetical protein
MKNTFVYYLIFCFIVIFISRIFITDNLSNRYGEHMSNIGNAINILFESDSIQYNENSSVGSLRDTNTIEDKVNYDDYKTFGKKMLEFGIYMPENLITDISIEPNRFMSIKELVLEKSMLLDYGAVAYFSYTFRDTMSSPDNFKLEMIYSNDAEEINYYRNTNINDVKGLILEKELYLENGAIYYFAYKF